MYKNLQNNTVILDEDILRIKDGVMTFFNGNTWSTISINDIQEIESEASSQSKNTNNNINNVYVFKPDITLKAGLCIPNNVSYYKTQKITITPGSYIKLIADYDEYEDGSIEFYIIDNKDNNISLYDAIPIRPENIDYIKRERCWFNKELRFSHDEDDSITFYTDGVIDNGIKALSDIDFSNGKNYTVSYKPKVHTGTTYSPKNSYISLLMVLRSYNNTKKPPYIKNVKIIESRGD